MACSVLCVWDLKKVFRTICFLPLLLAGALRAQQGMIQPGAPWLDDRGEQMQAHGGGITLWQGSYFWFGEDRSNSNDPEKRYVSCYSSKDLVHWKFRRTVIAISDPEHLGPGWVLERPKVFANAHTKKFVLYAHLDDAKYKLARVAVFTSNSIDGEYRFVRSFRPLGQESRDIGQFVDDDGAAYLLFESRPTGGFFLARLSSDYLSVEKEIYFFHAPLEGGALVHFGNSYYLVGSHLSGWAPNANVYAVSGSLQGPWSEFQNIAPAEVKTYGSQSSMLLRVAGTKVSTVIFMGDMWRPKDLANSRYLWMPLLLGDSKLVLPAPRPWSIDTKTGLVRFNQ